MDVYDDSPTIVTIWLTIMPKLAILIFLLEFCLPGATLNLISTVGHGISDPALATAGNGLAPAGEINLSEILKKLILISFLLSLIIGTVLGLVQNKNKRLLA